MNFNMNINMNIHIYIYIYNDTSLPSPHAVAHRKDDMEYIELERLQRSNIYPYIYGACEHIGIQSRLPSDHVTTRQLTKNASLAHCDV